MTSHGFDIDTYLDRIGVADPPAADAAGLALLHEAHLRAIPFENIDVLLDRPPLLTPAALQDKLVARRRGGYCFEQNGLFHLALAASGFRLRPHLARVLFNRPLPGPRTHQFLTVSLDGRDWLADVGFGGPGLFSPLPLEPGRVDTQHGMRFRLHPDPELGMILQRGRDDGWVDLYAFADEACLPVDIEMGNHFTATSAQSPFRRTLVCARTTASGRVTLNGARLAIFDGAGNDSRLLSGADDLRSALAAQFSLILEPDEPARLAPFLA
jgi:N-hydroxyarylamine O-acetyltransferase